MADSPEQAAAGRTPRSEATRTRIVEAALRLFRENGYDRTTMRAIAREAGVSVGNAYYYFKSKEELVQGFYDSIAEQHRRQSMEILAGERELAPRLRGVLLGWVDLAAPYHEFGKQFFVNAADPDSPLSPFSPESSPARDAQIAIHREVVEGSTARVDPELRADLPELIWLFHMAVVLYWVHDRSPDCQRTRMLVERTVPMIDKVVGLSRLRVLRPVTHELTDLLKELLIKDLIRPKA